MKEQLKLYKDALKFLNGNTELTNALYCIKRRYIRGRLLSAMFVIAGVLSGIAYMVATVCYKSYRGVVVLSNLSIAVGILSVAIQSFLIGMLVYYMVTREPLRVSNNIISLLNSRLYSCYRCEHSDKLSLLFSGGKCYVKHKDLGIVAVREGISGEENCKVESRTWYEVTPDCRIWKLKDYFLMDV